MEMETMYECARACSLTAEREVSTTPQIENTHKCYFVCVNKKNSILYKTICGKWVVAFHFDFQYLCRLSVQCGDIGRTPRLLLSTVCIQAAGRHGGAMCWIFRKRAKTKKKSKGSEHNILCRISTLG